MAIETEAGTRMTLVFSRRRPSGVWLIGNGVPVGADGRIFQNSPIGRGTGIPGRGTRYRRAVGVVAVEALDIDAAARIRDGTVNSGGSIPPAFVGRCVSVGRQGLRSPLLCRIGNGGIFPPGGGSGLTVTGSHAGAVPGILPGRFPIPERCCRVIPVAVAPQAVAADLLDFGTVPVGGVLYRGYAGTVRSGPRPGTVDDQVDGSPGSPGMAIGAVDAPVAVRLPMTLVAVGIGDRSLDMVRAGTELGSDGSPIALRYTVAVKAEGACSPSPHCRGIAVTGYVAAGAVAFGSRRTARQVIGVSSVFHLGVLESFQVKPPLSGTGGMGKGNWRCSVVGMASAAGSCSGPVIIVMPCMRTVVGRGIMAAGAIAGARKGSCPPHRRRALKMTVDVRTRSEGGVDDLGKG